MANTQKPWEHAKSAGSEHDALAARFVESLSYDTRLYKHDIAGSIAHARMLQKVNLITPDDLAAIERGLKEIEAEIESSRDEQGDFRGWGGWKIELEDVHMCIEAALIEKIGDPGRKLHTGRSRNDQVAFDLRLWLHDTEEIIGNAITDLIRAILKLAERDGDIVMPSYTHLQRAQPIVVGGELLAWVEAFQTAVNRFGGKCGYGVIDDSPLGSGAIAGSSLPLNRFLGDGNYEHGLVRSDGEGMIISPSANSIFSTAARDHAIDFVYALAMTAQWLSRWAEQWIIYMTTEFGFLKIGDAFTTGSSMMPQKRNPDMLELIRGRCGNIYGHLIALLTICKGLPIGYNRDLQEDKRHVFAAYDTVRDCLQMAAAIVNSAEFNEQRIAASLDRGFLDATSLAEYMVTKGVPFRSAHQHVGSLVRHCIEKSIVKLADLTVEQMRQISKCDIIAQDVYDWLGAENVVKRYQTTGNAGLSGYRAQLEQWKQRLAK